MLLGLAILLECSLAVSAFALASEERLGASVARGMRAAAERYGVEGEEDVTRGWEIEFVSIYMYACVGTRRRGNNSIFLFGATAPWGGAEGCV